MKIALISLAHGSGCPPIGLVYLATYLKKHLDVEVKIIDSNFLWLPSVPFKDYDLVGISAMTVNYQNACELGRSMKKVYDVPVVIGGVHISTCPESMDWDAFDAMVIGEGEKSIVEAVKEVCNCGKLLSKFYQYPAIEDLDDLPRPDWSLVDKRYFDRKANTTFAEFGVSGVMLTSRGCPYDCVFCSTKKMWGKPRFHSAQYVNMLINDLWLQGVTLVQIWDDLFTINRKRLKQIVATSDMKFNCQPRTDLIDDELCQILKQIGVTTCIFGFESGNDRVLRYLKRNTTTVEQNIKAIKCCHRNGLKVQGSVMLGSPNETLSDMDKTYDFVKWCAFNGVQRIWSFVATPFPATEWWGNQEVSQCSHYNIENPLLLDESVSKKDFKKIMLKIRRLENIFKIKKAVRWLISRL